MNVYLYSNLNDWEGSVIEHFKKTKQWNKVISNSSLITNNPHSEKLYMRENDLSKYTEVPFEVKKKMEQHLHQFVEMYCRNSKNSQNEEVSFSIYDYHHFFYLLVEHFYDALTTNQINLCIFNRPYHIGVDMVLYRLAEVLEIPVLTFKQSSLVPNRFFYFWKNEDYGTFSTATTTFAHEYIPLKKEFKKDLAYMKKKKKSKLRKLKESKEYKLFRELLDKDLRGDAIMRYNRKLTHKKNNTSLFTETPNFEQPFVYFGLHLQPELTTANWGGIFNDQLMALEQLSALIPEDWKIFVKENPKQQYFMRGEWFFKRLAKIPKIVFVESSTSTYDLIENCQFASTITGTIGWEAITGGKPVLIFGWGTWYKTMPGVTEYNSETTISSIMNNKINFDELEKKFNQLIQKTGVGVVYNKTWQSKIVSGYTKEKNIEAIIQSLDKILTQKFG